ncbi:MAG: hypothetical protein JSV81_02245 [Anaerolineales bacterium]|nr:MAG: hypothetical protein JSV81_02245 [Anaerolineales bacterium]
MSLRRRLSAEDQAALDELEQREQTAHQLRESVTRLRTAFSLQALRDQLPLHFPSAHTRELSFRALSWYSYPGWAPLAVHTQLKALTPFYVALLLIDFAPLRAELVALTEIHLNAAGQTPFDPVSLFLCCLLRWEKGQGSKTLAKTLAGPEGSCWRKLFGFREGATPAASTLRAFYTALGPAFHLDLCPRFIELIHTAGLLPTHSTHPRAPARQGLPIAADGMLHEAHSSMRCGQVTDTCYQPTSAQHPRPCPARGKGFDGCSCTEKECVQRCRYTTPRDPLARLIHYSGTNQEGEKDSSRARNVYGCRSYPQVLCDDELHAYWVAYASVHSANTDERHILPNDFAYLLYRLPKLQIGELVADSAVGYADCLHPLYDEGVIPVVVIRRDQTDKNAQTCQLRGYDKNGRPLCAHGYPMFFNGVDYPRLRTCWVCRQICSQQRPPRPEDTTCPFRDPNRPLGMVTHVGRAFSHPDGSRHERLARLYPYGSTLWKEHYGARKNAVEGRNSQITRLGLKRIWSYGLPGATADLSVADLLINLRTLGRLVQQATLLVS